MTTKSEQKIKMWGEWRSDLQNTRLRVVSRKEMAQQAAQMVPEFDTQIKALDDLIAFCDTKLANP